ncbi:putative E3 ubiquitin-protein ligase XBAT34 isoform X1 [Juglans microcarpa x Juglans regia]|uniref:putative E3 ubiquitin-protein ligase XBAT34 isoform X1 n=1 Tax=Juglans microcarpa x Juglans regia TaxID=2249226 RepID=UPI001B7EC212|nr:putative E3 ubiquitin-protein ligase XBAT34 isoform X1 [Juglans microcarpa x Juglans regia]
MGQSNSMSQQRPRAELLYELVSTGNVEAIKALCSEGASLEWIDREGRTPLILACMNPELIHVAKTLIELGANVNAYCPGAHTGTALHHAAEKGLEQSVKLLLSHGANTLVRNDDCQTPLDVARVKGHANIVRAIENHVCYFSGWLREFYGPSFLEALVPKLLSRTIWVVVIPFGSSNSTMPLKMELKIYRTLQDAQPRSVIALWKAKIEEPDFHQKEPALTIVDQFTKTRYKLASTIEGDKQQLQRLHNACIGIPQVMPPPVLDNTQTSTLEAAPQTSAEAVERPPAVGTAKINVSSNGRMDQPSKEDYNGWDLPDSGTVGITTQHGQTSGNVSPVAPTNSGVSTSASASVPSAPPIPKECLDEGPIHYPSIDFSPVDWSVPAREDGASVTNDVKDEGSSSSCIICWEAPVEGACIPCGHMAGCMSCLVEIKAKKGVCPVCRSNIKQVVRFYAV